MRYEKLAEVYEELSSTTKRLEKISILSKFLGLISKEDKDVIYLLIGRVYPEYDEKRIGISNQLAIKAIAKATGNSVKKINDEWRKKGDLGLVAQDLTKNKSQSTLHSHILTTKKVLENFRKLPALEGKGTVGKKMGLITELLTSASAIEAKYLVRSLIGDLRIGVQDNTVRDAMAEAFFKDKKEATKKIQHAIDRSNDLAEVFEIAKKGKISELEKIHIEVGNPIKAMLAQKVATFADGFKALGRPCAIEYKYDGFRCCTGNTSIYVYKKGLLSIREVKVGDKVLTHKGNFKKVVALNKRKIDQKERLFKIQSFLGNEFRITEKHSLQVYRDNKLKWIPSEELSKKDKLVFPIPKFNQKSLLKEKLILKNPSGYKKSIPVNKFFFRFLGYWIGDGFTNEFHNTERVGIIFNKKTGKELCDFYKKNLVKYFCLEDISENVHNGAIYLYWRDKPLRIWLSKHFRREWKGKMIPEWFFGISKKEFEEFLMGWIESDGHKDKLGRVNITTKERDLAMAVQLLALKFGKVIGVKKLNIKKSMYYKLIIPKIDKHFKYSKKNILFNILKYEEIDKPDPRINLYNLQVEDDESYCTTMAALHNCIIHKKGKEVKLFTRRLENVTKQFPEVVEYIQKYVKGKSFILDSEAVGYHKKTKEYTPFQDISQRIRRKYNIDKLRKELPIEVNVFDVVYHNGKSYLNEPFEKRTKLLRKIITPHPYKIIPAKQIISGDEKETEEFYKKALEDNQEGVMMKNLNAIYQPGSRVGHMLKIKPEVRDLDLVITGAEWGNGKRSGWLTSFILSCKNEKDGFSEIGKMSTGIKELEEQGVSYVEMTNLLKPLILKEKGKKVKIKPEVVISVTYQEIQKSPNYNSGFALRFPRFTALRPDRRADEITTLGEIKKDFEGQKRNWKYG